MAASSTAVTVLTPNGRRQTVKVSSSTPLLQVLEDVCKKHGFNSDEYDLKFQRNIVDLSLQWRFASLPNNAKLEMVPSTCQHAAARESTVRIALQLEDGSRLQDSFSCGQTLWELVNHFPQTRVFEHQLAEFTPLCVYMRDEISGEEALKKTTLKSLGLTAGTAIVRYVLKKTKLSEDREPMETVAMVMPTAKEEEGSEAVPKSSKGGLRPGELGMQLQTSAGAVVQMEPEQSVVTPPASPSSFPQSQSTESSVLTQMQGPQVVRPKIRPENDQEKAGEHPRPSGEALKCTKTTPMPDLSPVSKPAFVPFSGGGHRLGGSMDEGLGMWREAPVSPSSGGPPDAKKPKPSHDHKPVDREALVYHMDAGPQRGSVTEDLPDEFFEVTVDDVRKRFAQLKSERKQLEETPLMTKAQREAQMKEKMERYPKVVVRVQFPDRHVLQGFFRPLETVGALRQFVRSHLADPQTHFYLFITPPKVNLDDPSATLFQANLFPAALVYFGSDVKTDCYLQSDLLQSSMTASQADEAIASCMPRSPTSGSAPLFPEDTFPLPEASSALAGTAQEESGTDGQAEKPTRPDPGKVPKWLKLPGKK